MYVYYEDYIQVLIIILRDSTLINFSQIYAIILWYERL
jgi:hypothetical protein